MSVQPILKTTGIPDEFVRSVNDRLRELAASISAAPAPAPAVTTTAPEVLRGLPGRDGAPLRTQTVVTGSRAIGTTYQNATGLPMFVAVTLGCVSAGGATFAQASALTDSATPPTTAVASTFNGSATATVYEHLSFWVLPGNYYKIATVTNTVSLILWTEWQ